MKTYNHTLIGRRFKTDKYYGNPCKGLIFTIEAVTINVNGEIESVTPVEDDNVKQSGQHGMLYKHITLIPDTIQQKILDLL